MDTLSQTHEVVIDAVVLVVYLFQHYYVLVAFLLSLGNCIVDVSVCGLVALQEMLLCMFHNAVWT